MYKTVEKYYQMGLYTKEQVYNFYKKGAITQEQYKEIVGEE